MLELTQKNSNAVCEVDLFDNTGLEKAFRKLNWKKKHQYILDKKGDAVKCAVCEGTLNQHNISAFFPGSAKAVCLKPQCFMVALYRTEEAKFGSGE